MIDLFEIICCPTCKGEIEKNNGILICSSCRSSYYIADGIPDLIPTNLSEQIKSSVMAWSNLGYDYDEHIAKTSSDRLNAIDNPLLAKCNRGQMVLEIGCGTARLRKSVEQTGSHYIGLDPSLKLLKQGIARGEDNLIRGVGEYLPFINHSFDIILGGYCSFRYIQLNNLFSECARVLKPGGALAFTLWNNWSLYLGEILQNILKWQFRIPKFKYELCNDVISPWHEIKRLNQSGFTVESILSTRKVPLPQKLPFVKKIFNWKSYWPGKFGALTGYDIIFICKKKRPQNIT